MDAGGRVTNGAVTEDVRSDDERMNGQDSVPDANSRRFRRILSTCIHAGNAAGAWMQEVERSRKHEPRTSEARMKGCRQCCGCMGPHRSSLCLDV